MRQRGDIPSQLGFSEGVKAGLLADPIFANGAYTDIPEAGIRAFARIWAAGPSQAFYRHKLHQQLGQKTAADHMQEFLGAKLSGL